MAPAGGDPTGVTPARPGPDPAGGRVDAAPRADAREAAARPAAEAAAAAKLHGEGAQHLLVAQVLLGQGPLARVHAAAEPGPAGLLEDGLGRGVALGRGLPAARAGVAAAAAAAVLLGAVAAAAAAAVVVGVAVVGGV